MALPSVKLGRTMVYPLKNVDTEVVAGFLSIKCDEELPGIDISKNHTEFLLETATIAGEIVKDAHLAAFFRRKKMALISVMSLLAQEDYFAANPNSKLTKMLLAYHVKYGVPVVSFWTEHNFFVEESDLPEEWQEERKEFGRLREILQRKQVGIPVDRDEVLDRLTEILKAPVYPLVFSLPFFIDFYNRFITEQTKDALMFERNSMGIHISASFALEEEHNRVLYLSGDRVENAAYAAMTVSMMNNNGLRFCKNCGKLFVADRPSAEYCSPRCRNTYNVKMTRARKAAEKEADH